MRPRTDLSSQYWYWLTPVGTPRPQPVVQSFPRTHDRQRWDKRRQAGANEGKVAVDALAVQALTRSIQTVDVVGIVQALGRAEQQAIDNAEHRRVGADAERQGKHHAERKDLRAASVRHA